MTAGGPHARSGSASVGGPALVLAPAVHVLGGSEPEAEDDVGP